MGNGDPRKAMLFGIHYKLLGLGLTTSLSPGMEGMDIQKTRGNTPPSSDMERLENCKKVQKASERTWKKHLIQTQRQ
eukprot:jgi/Psemu1/32621/gm1.32621_g